VAAKDPSVAFTPEKTVALFENLIWRKVLPV